MAEAINDGHVYVAVSKDVGESKSTLLWALRNFQFIKLFLLHVHQQTPMSPTSSGLEQSEISAIQESELTSSYESVYKYYDICEGEGVIGNDVDIHYVQADNVGEGIVDFIYENNIKNLIIGAAADSHYTEVMVNVTSSKAKYVTRHAPHCCNIWLVCNGNLIQVREGRAGSTQSSSESLSSHHDPGTEGGGIAEHGTESDAPDVDRSARGFETTSDEEQKKRLETEQHDMMEREREEALISSSSGITQIRYIEEVSQRIEAEEELSRAISEIESMKMVQKELQEQLSIEKQRDKDINASEELMRCLYLEEGEPSSPSPLQGSVSATPPPSYICPITMEIMRDPHVAADGFSYEAEEIKRWLSNGGVKSPMTNLTLEHCNVTPNITLRTAINEWLEQNPQSLDA